MILRFLKLLGISLAYGLVFAWMVAFGLALGIGTALERTAHACHLRRTTITNWEQVIIAISVLAAVAMMIGAAADTFKNGSGFDLARFGPLHLLTGLCIAAATIALIGLMPFWVGCSLYF